MKYKDALEYMAELSKFGFNLGLSRIEKLLKLLGNPEKELSVVHIGGTNGKGSTTAILNSIITQAKYQVGTFTSPHLHCYRERTMVGNEKIKEVEFSQLVEIIKPLCEQMVAEGYEHPTEFEVSTAMSLKYFSEKKVDLVLLEVGLGGAIDSTNVVQPLLSVLTNVTMEHMEYLGDTIEEIAMVKAGIIKENTPVVTAAEDPKVLQVIEKVIAEKGAHLYRIDQMCTWKIKEMKPEGMTMDIQIKDSFEYTDLFLSLIGEHQAINCATALVAVQVLKDKYHFNIAKEHVYKGVDSTKWPARMEIIHGKPPVLIDGAHNVAGVESLKRALTRGFAYSNLILVVGMLVDKERQKAISILAPLAGKIIITKPNSPRAGKWKELSEYATQFCQEVYLEENINKAVDKALELGREQPGSLVCVTGSLYMVANARHRILNPTCLKQ